MCGLLLLPPLPPSNKNRLEYTNNNTNIMLQSLSVIEKEVENIHI